jgi:hypothetical protein
MKQLLRVLSIASLTVSLGTGLAAQSPGFSAADSKELASYRLTIETTQKVHGMMRSMIQEAAKDPKVQALMKTEAEIDALEAKDDLSDAESERLDTLREQKEQQEAAVEATHGEGLGLNNATTLDEMEAGMKKNPQLMAALTRAGLTPREYSKFFMASLMAGMVAGFQKAGTIKELPKELKEIHPDNIKFMLEHEAELTAMQKELAALGKGLK